MKEKPGQNDTFKLTKENFEEIFRELYAPLCRFCLQYVRIPQLAEDIVQNQFIYVWEKREKIKIKVSLHSYMYTSVKNNAINYLKSSYRKLQFENESVLLNNIEEGHNPELIIEGKEMANKVEEALRALPERCYTVFSLSRYAQMSNKDIAGHLDISVKTVENHMTVALKKIRSVLKTDSG